MTKIINEVNADIDKIIKKNKAELNTALIKPIHPQHQFSSNGLYCFIGKMGSGKTYYIMKHMAEDGLIEGIDFAESIGGTPSVVGLENAEITPDGIGYLLDNNLIAKARKFLKDVKEITPFV